MALQLVQIWVGSILIGAFGAGAALSDRWVRVLALNIVAGIYSIALLNALQGSFAAALFEAGDAYVWLTMLSPVAMWVMLGIGQCVAMLKRRSRLVQDM